MAQLYCRGELLTWDAKITTFPGLYVIGAAYAWAAQLLLCWTGADLVRYLSCCAPLSRQWRRNTQQRAQHWPQLVLPQAAAGDG